MILPPPPPFPSLTADLNALGREARAQGEGASLRRSPSNRGAVLADLGPATPVRVLGATGSWYRILLPDGRMGYTDPTLVGFVTAEEGAAAAHR